MSDIGVKQIRPLLEECTAHGVGAAFHFTQMLTSNLIFSSLTWRQVAKKRFCAQRSATAMTDKPVSLILSRKVTPAWLAELKGRIHTVQHRAALAVNRELVGLYWQIGRDILARQA